MKKQISKPLQDAIEAFEDQHQRRSTPEDLPQILKSIPDVSELINPTDRLVMFLSRLSNPDPKPMPKTTPMPQLSPQYREKYDEVRKQLNLPKAYGLIEHKKIVVTLIKQHPDAFQKDNPEDMRTFELFRSDSCDAVQGK
jgi:hypothetical protein